MKSVTEYCHSNSLGPNLSLLASLEEDPASLSIPQVNEQTTILAARHCCVVCTAVLRRARHVLHQFSPELPKQILEGCSAHSAPTG